MNRVEHQRRPGRSSKWITKTRRLAIYLRDEFTCSYCGRDLHNVEPGDIALDHIVSRETFRRRGITDNRIIHANTNVITSCRVCNRGKGDRRLAEYATPGALERIRRNRRRVPNMKLAKAIMAGEAPMPGREA